MIKSVNIQSKKKSKGHRFELGHEGDHDSFLSKGKVRGTMQSTLDIKCVLRDFRFFGSYFFSFHL